MTAFSGIVHWSIVWTVGIALTLTYPASSRRPTWKYQPVSINFNSSDVNRMNWAIRVERIARGEYAISGTMAILIDIDEDSNMQMEANSYYSTSTNLDWKRLPFGAPRQHFLTMMKDYYRKFFMDSVKNCSDFVQYEKGDKITVPRKTYTMNKCVISTEKFPEYMRPGIYKLEILGFGEVEFTFEAIISIEPNVY